MNSKIEYAFKNYITFVHWYLNMWFSWLDETQEIYCLTTNNETGVSLAILREKTVKCQREPVNKSLTIVKHLSKWLLEEIMLYRFLYQPYLIYMFVDSTSS